MGDLRRHLREAAHRLEENGWSGEIAQVIRHGKAEPQIVETAIVMSCDVVLMATHGRTGVHRALLGSVTDYVVSRIQGAAVLLVRP